MTDSKRLDPIRLHICSKDDGINPLRLTRMQEKNGAISRTEANKIYRDRQEALKKQCLEEKKWSENSLTKAQAEEVNQCIDTHTAEEAGEEEGLDAYSVQQSIKGEFVQTQTDPKRFLKTASRYTFEYLPLKDAKFFVQLDVVEAFLSGKVNEKDICAITKKVVRGGKEINEVQQLVLTGQILDKYGVSIAKFHPLKLDEQALSSGTLLLKKGANDTVTPQPIDPAKDLDAVGKTIWQPLEYTDADKKVPLLLSPQEAFHLLVNLAAIGVEKPWEVLRPGEPRIPEGYDTLSSAMPGGGKLPEALDTWPSTRGIGAWRPYYLNVSALRDEKLTLLKAFIGKLPQGNTPIDLQQREPNSTRVTVIQEALGALLPKSIASKMYPLKLNEPILSAGTGRIKQTPKELNAEEVKKEEEKQEHIWKRLEYTDIKNGSEKIQKPLLLSPQEAFHLLLNMALMGVADSWKVLRPGSRILPDGMTEADARVVGGGEIPDAIADWTNNRKIGALRPYYIDVRAIRDAELQRLQTLVGKALVELQETQGQATRGGTPIEEPDAPNPERASVIQQAIGALVPQCKASSAPTIEIKFARQDDGVQQKIKNALDALDTKAPMLTKEMVDAEEAEAKQKNEVYRGRKSSTVGLKPLAIAWLVTLLEDKGRTGAVARCHGDSEVDLNVSFIRDKALYRDVDEALATMLSGLSPTSTDAMALQNLKAALEQDGQIIGGELATERSEDANKTTTWIFKVGVPAAVIGGAVGIWQIGVSLFNVVAGGLMDFSPERLARGVTFLGEVGAVVNEISARQTRIVQRAEKLWIRDRRKLLKLTDITKRNARLFWLRKNKKWQKFVTEAERQERIKEDMLKAGLDLDIYPNGERSESDEQRRAVSEYSFQHKSEFESNPLTPRALEIYAKAKATYDTAHAAGDPLDVDAWTRAVEAERPAARLKYASGETPLNKWAEDLVELDRTPGKLRRANLQIREREIVQVARNLAAGQNTGLDSINGGVGKDLIWNGTAHLLRLATDFEAGKSAQGAAYQPNPEWTALSPQLKIAGLEMVEAKVELYRLKEGAVASGGAGDRGLTAGQVPGILLDIQDGMRDESSEQVGTRDPSKPLRPGAVRRGGLAQLQAEGKKPMLVVSELKIIFSIGAYRGNEGGDLKYILGALEDGRFPMSGNWTYRDKAEALMSSAPGVSRFDGIHVDDLDVDKAGQALMPMRDAVEQGSATQPPMIVEIDALQELARLVDAHRGTEAWDLRNPVDAKAYELIPEEHRQSMPKDAHGNPVAPSSGLGRPVRQAFEAFIKWRIGEQLAGMRADGGVAELRAARERLLKESDGSPLRITVADVTRFAAYRWPPNAVPTPTPAGSPVAPQPSARYAEAETDLRGKLADLKTEFPTHDVSDLEALVDAGLAEMQGKSNLEIAQMRRALKKEIATEASALRAPQPLPFRGPRGFFTPDIFLRPVEALVEYVVIKPAQALVRGAEVAMRFAPSFALRQAQGERGVSGVSSLSSTVAADLAALDEALKAERVGASAEVDPARAAGRVPMGEVPPVRLAMSEKPAPPIDWLGDRENMDGVAPDILEAVKVEVAKAVTEAAKVYEAVKAEAVKAGKERR